MDDGQERPVAMSSRTLHTHERRYSQLDKEATAIMFGIKKFHNYLAGRYFTVVTDHKPLLGIFNPKKPMPVILSPRLTRIAIALTSHDYDIVYRPGTEIGNADSLSRWPLPVADQEEQPLYEVLLMADKTEDFPYTAREIALETEKDQTLSRIIRYLRYGWPNKVNDKNLHTYWLHRTKLSLQDGCILLGCRVVIPPSLRQAVLNMLHTTHNGIVHTKSLARSYVWWPHLDNDIINLVSNCIKCLENRQMPGKSNHEWVLPSRPWSRIHVDFAGPFLNKIFLIVVDAYSRWPEVFIVNNTTSNTVIRHLRMVFATHGLCETIVSDNGTAFVSNEMGTFLNANKIRHITTAPYHPATNGLAERMVQTVKNKLKKIEGSLDVKIPNMLLGLRVTPCTSTNKSPAELLFNRRLRTVIDNLHPDYLQHKKLESQIINIGQKKNRETSIGEKVMYRNYNQSGSKWLPGQIINKEGPSNYRVQADDGTIVRRHIDQIIKFKNNDSAEESEVNTRNIQNDVIEELENEEVIEEMDPVEINNGSEQQEEHTEHDNIIEIPSAEHWEQMLGIPRSSEITMAGGKIRNKLNAHSKAPYARPHSRQDTNYMF